MTASCQEVTDACVRSIRRSMMPSSPKSLGARVYPAKTLCGDLCIPRSNQSAIRRPTVSRNGMQSGSTLRDELHYIVLVSGFRCMLRASDRGACLASKYRHRHGLVHGPVARAPSRRGTDVPTERQMHTPVAPGANATSAPSTVSQRWSMHSMRCRGGADIDAWCRGATYPPLRGCRTRLPYRTVSTVAGSHVEQALASGSSPAR